MQASKSENRCAQRHGMRKHASVCVCKCVHACIEDVRRRSARGFGARGAMPTGRSTCDDNTRGSRRACLGFMGGADLRAGAGADNVSNVS